MNATRFFILKSLGLKGMWILLLFVHFAFPSWGYALRPIQAGMEESPTRKELEAQLKGKEEEEEALAMPHRLVFDVHPEQANAVTLTLQTEKGTDIVPIQVRVRKHRVEITPIPGDSRTFITYRKSSLQKGAVFEYTLFKTKKVLRLVRSGQVTRWRPVRETVYFFPMELVEWLMANETDPNRSPAIWRQKAFYVFSDLGQDEHGVHWVELRYRNPSSPPSQPARELNASSQVTEAATQPDVASLGRWIDGLTWMDTGQVVPEQLWPLLEPGGKAMVVPAQAPWDTVGVLGISAGIQDVKKLADHPGIRVRRYPSLEEAHNGIRMESHALFLVTAEEFENGWGNLKVPMAIVSSDKAAELTADELAVIAAIAKGYRIVRIRDIVKTDWGEGAFWIVKMA